MTIRVKVTNDGAEPQLICVAHINPFTHAHSDIHNKQLAAGESAEFYVHTTQSLVVSEVNN